MEAINQQLNKEPITEEELQQVIHFFTLLGYKPNQKTRDKIIGLARNHPDKDFVLCAQEMYEWFDEAAKRGRQIKSYHLTFRNWVSKDYAPKKKQPENFFDRSDLY